EGAPMHVSSVAIYDRGSAPGGRVGYADVLRYFGERVHRSGLFRRRITALPLGVARPYWIADGTFDLEYHIRHIALPKPGDWRQFVRSGGAAARAAPRSQ